MQKRDLVSYTLILTGLFGRNRKVKREHFKLAEFATVQGLEVLRPLLAEKLASIKVKGSAQVVVLELHEVEELKDVGDGVTMRIRSCSPMDSKAVIREDIVRLDR